MVVLSLKTTAMIRLTSRTIWSIPRHRCLAQYQSLSTSPVSKSSKAISVAADKQKSAQGTITSNPAHGSETHKRDARVASQELLKRINDVKKENQTTESFSTRSQAYKGDWGLEQCSVRRGGVLTIWPHLW